MIDIYRTIDNNLVKTQAIEDGCWINLVNPDDSEVALVCEALDIDHDMLKSALDEEERARIETELGKTLIIVDTPVIEKESKLNVYSTIPVGIILLKQCIVTVCLRNDTLLTDFVANKVKFFLTNFKTRFILQILNRNSIRYLQYLRHIDKITYRIEQDLHRSMKNKELFQMLKLEKSLVYFSTALKSNQIVLEKLLKFEHLKSYPDDTELLEDTIIENKQAIEMASIYGSILNGTMQAFASIISNNLNMMMKFLSSITIIMAIPTIISSFFGMNVTLPLNAQHAPNSFVFIVILSMLLCSIVAFILFKKRIF
jgi:magnesium transporter